MRAGNSRFLERRMWVGGAGNAPQLHIWAAAQALNKLAGAPRCSQLLAWVVARPVLVLVGKSAGSALLHPRTTLPHQDQGVTLGQGEKTSFLLYFEQKYGQHHSETPPTLRKAPPGSESRQKPGLGVQSCPPGPWVRFAGSAPVWSTSNSPRHLHRKSTWARNPFHQHRLTIAQHFV